MDGLIWFNTKGDKWEIGWVVVRAGDARGGPHHERGRGLGSVQRALVEVALEFGDDVLYALRKERGLGGRSREETYTCGAGESTEKN